MNSVLWKHLILGSWLVLILEHHPVRRGTRLVPAVVGAASFLSNPSFVRQQSCPSIRGTLPSPRWQQQQAWNGDGPPPSENPINPNDTGTVTWSVSFSSSAEGDEPKELSEENPEDGYDEGLAAWVQSLGQWPLMPDAPPSPSIENPTQQSGAVRLSSPSPSGGGVGGTFLPNALMDVGALLRWQQQATASARQDPPPTTMAPPAKEDSFLDGLYSLLSVEKILQAGGTVLNEQQLGLGQWMGGLHRLLRLTDSADTSDTDTTGAQSPSVPPSSTQDRLFKLATAQLETLVVEASALLRSPEAVRDFVDRAAQVLLPHGTGGATAPKALPVVADAAKALAASQGLDTREAERRVREALVFASSVVAAADSVLRQGYVAASTAAAAPSSRPGKAEKTAASTTAAARALFADFASVRQVAEYTPPLGQAAAMGTLAGAIYEQTVPRTHALGHAIVAQGATSDVRWMVTDALVGRDAFDHELRMGGSPSLLVRTITIRGFDASDESVDREGLLNRVCTASPEPLLVGKHYRIAAHSGMLAMARDIYRDVKPYVLWAAPSHQIVFTGHSVGGSLSVLVLLLMTLDLGAAWVRSKVLRVFTYGSPPVLRRHRVAGKDAEFQQQRGGTASASDDYNCEVLEEFDLPSNLVEGYVQPWDPIVRLFSEIDPLYPLLSDVGEDGVTPWASGPPRTLRPITKAIMEAWDGWPRFRDTMGGTGNQTYRSVGVQHVLVPEPTRYLADRFVAVNIPAPPVEAILRVSSRELLPALEAAFPLDTFEISFVPQAIRSFVHHFYPAYGDPVVDFVQRLQSPGKGAAIAPASGAAQAETPGDSQMAANGTLAEVDEPPHGDPASDWTRAAQWLKGKDLAP